MKSLPTSIVLLPLLFLFSCSVRNEKKPGIEPDNSPDNVINAERFTLKKTDSCTIVTIINPWQGAEDIEQKYYLVRRGKKLSAPDDTSKIIYVPLKKIICMSTTHLAMIAALGEEDAVAGFSGTGFIYNNSLGMKAGRGLIRDVGYENNLNNELIISILPDLVMMYGIGNESTGYTGKISELGIKVMFNADYLETDPLGKAEWIKLFGALFCKEEIADSIYTTAALSYNEIKNFVSINVKKRPKVLLGLPFRDTWYISPGNSYISKLIRDAGGEYLWETTESSVSMPYSLESVYIKSLEADYWLNIGNVTSKEEISSIDSRLQTIPSYGYGNLYNNNKLVTQGGGNDYWENGTINPHLILKDISSILHPGLFENYELTYYRKIE